MEYTKGEWKAKGQRIQSVENGLEIIAATYCPTLMPKEQAIGNAHLIVAAVNACASVNPDNPVAIAESIKDMYEALKGLLSISLAVFTPEHKAAIQALAKAKDKVKP